MNAPSPDVFNYWYFLTRLGEAQHLLPAAFLAGLMLVRTSNAKNFAMHWLQALAVAALLTTASKLAFIGWGIGNVRWNFTGISGHAMFAAAVYPLLAGALASHVSTKLQKWAVGISFALVILVGISRIMVGAHSVSEVVAGLLLGCAVSLLVVYKNGLPQSSMSYWIPLVVATWLIFTPMHAPQLPTHSLVTQLALFLSGHSQPFTRHDLLHKQLTPQNQQPLGSDGR
jgi:hypothetical protein